MMPRRVALSESAGSPYLMAKNSHFASPVRQHELACIVSSGPTHSAKRNIRNLAGPQKFTQIRFEFYANWARLTVRRPRRTRALHLFAVSGLAPANRVRI
jgi:hypothetical protein